MKERGSNPSGWGWPTWVPVMGTECTLGDTRAHRARCRVVLLSRMEKGGTAGVLNQGARKRESERDSQIHRGMKGERKQKV